VPSVSETSKIIENVCTSYAPEAQEKDWIQAGRKTILKWQIMDSAPGFDEDPKRGRSDGRRDVLSRVCDRVGYDAGYNPPPKR